MKKTLLVLAIALMAVPAWATATVSVTAEPNGCGADISYTVSGTPRVRAFALDITVDGGQTIDSVTVGNTKYNIYPGTVVITNNAISDAGTPVAVKSQLPSGTQDGIGSSGVTIEMGSLYVGEANAPAASGKLVTITVSGSCNVSIAANSGRGGVVTEDLSAPSVTYTGTTVTCGSGECKFDWDGFESNGYTNLDDLYAMLYYLAPTAPDFEQPVGGDISPIWDYDNNDYVNLDDLYVLLYYLSETAPDYELECGQIPPYEG